MAKPQIESKAESEEDFSDYDFTNLSFSEYLKKRARKPPQFDLSMGREPFPVQMVPTKALYTSSDSDSDSEAIVEEESKIHLKVESEEDFADYDFTNLTFSEYLKKRARKPPQFDLSKGREPFPVQMVPTKALYTSSDCSDSDSEAGAEEESEIQKENLTKDRAEELEFQLNAASKQDKTTAEPREERLDLEYDSETQANKPVPVQTAKSSTTEFISKPMDVPASSILVKHGTKRPAEAGDKDSKRAKEMASQTEGSGKKSTGDQNEGGGSSIFL